LIRDSLRILKYRFVSHRLAILTSAAIGLFSLLWTVPLGNLLYGQDGIKPFWYPLGINNSALVPYSYQTDVSRPTSDSAPSFFLQILSLGLNSITRDPALTERVEIFLAVTVASLGVFFLLRTLNRIDRLPAETGELAMAFAAFLYCTNPFTLSVVIPKILQWSLFIVLLPFIVDVSIAIAYSQRGQWVKAGTLVVLALVLAPGISGVYAACLLLLFSFAGLTLVVRYLTGSLDRKRTIEGGAILLLVYLAIEIPTTLLLILSESFGQATGIYSINVLTTFSQGSATTNFANVLTLTAFSWLANNPGAYSWISILPLLRVVAFTIPAVMCVALMVSYTSRGLKWVTVLALVAVLFAVGVNPPVGPLDLALVQLGGPFLALVNGYNYFGQIYLIGFTVSVFATVKWAQQSLLSPTQRVMSSQVNPDRGGDPSQPGHASLNRRRRGPPNTRSRAGAIGALAVLVVTAGVFATPLTDPGPYQYHGSSIAGFPTPTSFSMLRSFLSTYNESSPSYFTLFLPLSSSNSSYVLQINNQSFVDTGQLLAGLSPYPALTLNNSALSQSVADLAYESSPGNLLSVLEAAHIKFVVLSPYYRAADPALYESGTGLNYDVSFVSSNLAENLGAPHLVGKFQVFQVANPIPIAYAISGLPVVLAPSYLDYLEALDAFNRAATPLSETMKLAVWSPTSLTQATSAIVPEATNSGLVSLSLPSGDSGFLLTTNGTLVNVEHTPGDLGRWVSYDNATRMLESKSFLETSSANRSDVNTTMTYSNGTYLNSLGQSNELTLTNPVIANASEVTLQFRVGQLAPKQNWIFTNIQEGSVTLTSQIFENPDSNVSNLLVGALCNGTIYAWDNVPVPVSVLYNSTFLNVSLTPGLAVTSVADGTGQVVTRASLHYLPQDAALNGGFNRTAAPQSLSSFSKYTLMLGFWNPEGTVQTFEGYSSPPVAYALTVNGSLGYSISTSVATSPTDGSIAVNLPGNWSTQETTVVLAYPDSPKWTISQPGGTFAKIDGLSLYNLFLEHGTALTQVRLSFQSAVPWEIPIAAFEIALIVVLSASRRFRWAVQSGLAYLYRALIKANAVSSG
jgi:hypothetical protein